MRYLNCYLLMIKGTGFMQNGMQSAKKTLERKEKSQDIIKKWKEKGLPELPNDLSEISIRERE